MAWMILRGQGWRRGIEMVLAMTAPVAAIIVLGQLAGYAYLPGLVYIGYPAMTLGVLVYMLFRRNHFTGPSIAQGMRPTPHL
jgi:hypothetical protein